MTPLERAARALHDASESVRFIPDPSKPNERPAEIRFRDPPKWEDQPQIVRDAYTMRARAVIKAIREPIEEAAVFLSSSTDGSSYPHICRNLAVSLNALLEEGA